MRITDWGAIFDDEVCLKFHSLCCSDTRVQIVEYLLHHCPSISSALILFQRVFWLLSREYGTPLWEQWNHILHQLWVTPIPTVPKIFRFWTCDKAQSTVRLNGSAWDFLSPSSTIQVLPTPVNLSELVDLVSTKQFLTFLGKDESNEKMLLFCPPFQRWLRWELFSIRPVSAPWMDYYAAISEIFLKFQFGNNIQDWVIACFVGFVEYFQHCPRTVLPPELISIFQTLQLRLKSTPHEHWLLDLLLLLPQNCVSNEALYQAMSLTHLDFIAPHQSEK